MKTLSAESDEHFFTEFSSHLRCFMLLFLGELITISLIGWVLFCFFTCSAPPSCRLIPFLLLIRKTSQKREAMTNFYHPNVTAHKIMPHQPFFKVKKAI